MCSQVDSRGRRLTPLCRVKYSSIHIRTAVLPASDHLRRLHQKWRDILRPPLRYQAKETMSDIARVKIVGSYFPLVIHADGKGTVAVVGHL
jgi:hypothetical protein